MSLLLSQTGTVSFIDEESSFPATIVAVAFLLVSSVPEEFVSSGYVVVDESHFSPSVALDLSAQSSTGLEEYVAQPPVALTEEWSYSVNPRITSWTSWTPEEEFGGSHPSEEVGNWCAVFSDVPTSRWTQDDEFSGSIPFEVGTFSAQVVNLRITYSSVWEEEFGGAQPSEEGSYWWFAAPDAAVAQSCSPVEEFAGAHPTEETSLWVAIPAGDNAWVSWTPEEEFGGAHPFEETGTWTCLLSRRRLVTNPTEEEFGGAHPIEEAIVVYLSTISSAPAFSWSSPEEDFVGEQFKYPGGWEPGWDGSYFTTVGETVEDDSAPPTISTHEDLDALVYLAVKKSKSRSLRYEVNDLLLRDTETETAEAVFDYVQSVPGTGLIELAAMFYAAGLHVAIAAHEGDRLVTLVNFDGTWAYADLSLPLGEVRPFAIERVSVVPSLPLPSWVADTEQAIRMMNEAATRLRIATVALLAAAVILALTAVVATKKIRRLKD